MFKDEKQEGFVSLSRLSPNIFMWGKIEHGGINFLAI